MGREMDGFLGELLVLILIKQPFLHVGFHVILSNGVQIRTECP
jgi:hypothetical protein